MYKIFALVLLFVSSYSYSQNLNDTTGSRISPGDAQLVLQHHNMARGQVGVAGLTWSKQLAAYAQQWADSLASTNTFEHRVRPGQDGQKYGENIFAGSSGYTALDASHDWYAEKKDYVYGPFNISSAEAAGHYTQMVWRDTKQVGVGVAFTADGSIIVVANYYPEGNMMAETPY